MAGSTVFNMRSPCAEPQMWRGAAHEARGIAAIGPRAEAPVDVEHMRRRRTLLDMSDQPAEEAHRTGRRVRLDPLVRLRWLAVIGQSTAVLVVYFGLEYELPIWPCLAVIALTAWLNVALRLRFRMTQRVEPDRAAWLLAFDIAELPILVFLPGGLENPFAFLFLGPVLLSATALPPRLTLMLGGFVAACATVLIFVLYPLPWAPDQQLELPPIYTMGVWLSLLLA